MTSNITHKAAYRSWHSTDKTQYTQCRRIKTPGTKTTNRWGHVTCPDCKLKKPKAVAPVRKRVSPPKPQVRTTRESYFRKNKMPQSNIVRMTGSIDVKIGGTENDS